MYYTENYEPKTLDRIFGHLVSTYAYLLYICRLAEILLYHFLVDTHIIKRTAAAVFVCNHAKPLFGTISVP